MKLLTIKMVILRLLKANMKKQMHCGIKRIWKNKNLKQLLNNNIENQWNQMH